jgi:hypothetical protein
VPEDKNFASQLLLVESDEWWQKEWQNMPEFVQDDLMPYRTVYVHFSTQADLEDFAKLVKHPEITGRVKYMWYPGTAIRSVCKLRYVDDVQEKDLPLLKE